MIGGRNLKEGILPLRFNPKYLSGKEAV